jgi:SecD/SecF fusion protein
MSMGKDLRNRLLVIAGVIAAALFFTFPVNQRINLGLDLEGGMHLILRVETEKLTDDAKSDAVLRAIEILRNRIDSIGVGETVIQRQGENQILIQLPGVTDREDAINLIGRVAQLEFRLVDNNPTRLAKAIETGAAPDGYILKHIKKEGNEPVLLEDKVSLSGETVADARVDFDPDGFGLPQISLEFNSQGARQFSQLTRNNVNRRLAMILDGEVLSAPNINEAIPSGKAQITGQFSFAEASMLALALRSGALPAPMRIEEERTIGPLLGQDSINAGIIASVTGGALVLIFMLGYYLTAGLISNVALVINLLMIFGIMGFLNAMLPESQLTLTLPGIAGIILTLGMAVDANILINERIREELEIGKPLKSAINNGFSKALKAIIDSNATTLIAAFMLFQFGSGPIKGFAVTLTIGLVSSLFTAVFVTKTLFHAGLVLGCFKSLPMLRLLSNTSIDFISRRFVFFGLSVIMVIASLTVFFQKKEGAYGIDFVGGQIQEYQFARPVDSNDLRAALNEAGIADIVIQRFAEYPGNVIIRTSETTYDPVTKNDRITQILRTRFADNTFEILRIESVGPIVGKALRKAALLAIIFALGGILVFVGFRFKHFDFATAGVIALLHDVIVTTGILLMFGRQIDLLVVTSLLTIAGYSINDTIIIYDRVRENMVKMARKPMAEIINLSVNQTLGRTLLTTITTLLVVGALYVKGGEVLNTFALCLIIGFITGTYSTIFIASPLVLAWDKKKNK